MTKQPFIDIDMLDILGHLYNMDGHKIETEDLVDNKKLIQPNFTKFLSPPKTLQVTIREPPISKGPTSAPYTRPCCFSTITGVEGGTAKESILIIKVRNSFLGSALEVKDLMGQTRCNIMIDWGNPPDNPFNIIYERAALLQREMI